MNETKTIEGLWWIEGADRPCHFGILTYDSTSGLLLTVKIPVQLSAEEILGVLKTPPDEISQTIVGRDKDNHPVSLFGCNLAGLSTSGGLKSCKIHSLAGIFGREFSSWPDVRFKHINAEYSLLHNWIGKTRATMSGGDAWTITLGKRAPIEFDLDGATKVVIWPTQKFSQNGGASTNTVIEESHAIEFRFNEERPVKETLHKYIDSFRRFLTMLCNKPVFVDRVYFCPDASVVPYESTLLKSNPGSASACRHTTAHQMPVSHIDISGIFEHVVRSWFALEDNLNDVLNLYFSVVFTPGLYIHQKFLFLAQALEVYHRTSKNFTNYIQSKSEFRARKKAILDKVPEESEWLTEKLQHANEKTLAQRLAELMELRRDQISKFIDDPKIFSDLIRNSRNHYTHYGTGKKGMNKVATGIQLIDLTAKMRLLLEINIFADLGISGAPVDRMIHELQQQRYGQI